MRQLLNRKWARFLLAAAMVLLLAGGTWAAVWWARYPKAPDVSKVSVDDAARFIGTDEFGRLTKGDRKRYVISIAERTRTMPFKDVVKMMMTDVESRKSAAKNINDLPQEDKDEIGSAFMTSFLDGFYAQTPTERQGFLVMIALAEKAARSNAATQPTTPSHRRPGDTGIPSPEQLEKEMGKILAKQSPRTVAQMTNLFLEMRRTKDFLGMK